LGEFGTGKTSGSAKAIEDEAISTTIDETVELLKNARSVTIAPGYGMAVAQAQHAVADITRILRDRGVTVRSGIHPVAGRLPGHMNVLLAVML
jgi:H+-translocating NAD(P) transhydrogenase subunit beta